MRNPWPTILHDDGHERRLRFGTDGKPIAGSAIFECIGDQVLQRANQGGTIAADLRQLQRHTLFNGHPTVTNRNLKRVESLINNISHLQQLETVGLSTGLNTGEVKNLLD